MTAAAECAHGGEARPYRAGVGVALFNRDGLAFIARRNDQPAHAPAWQFPQGGLDPGETPAAAARRELAEETGVVGANIIGEAAGWLSYDLPPELAARAWDGRYRGQRQKWFAMRFHGADRDINLDACDRPEFDAWRWAPLAEAPNLVVGFKRPVYETLVREFARFARPVHARA